LTTEFLLRPPDLNIAPNTRFATQQESEGLFVEEQVQCGSPITQEACQQGSEVFRPVGSVAPLGAIEVKENAVLSREGSVDELVLDTVLSEVHGLAVLNFAQKHIIEKLSLMPRGESINRLELKRPALRHENVYVLEFLEAVVSKLDGDFELNARVTAGQFAFVDLFVKKAAHFLVDLEDAAHNRIGHLAKFGLGDAADGRAESYRHRLQIKTEKLETEK
jgi:hypothetical protein